MCAHVDERHGPGPGVGGDEVVAALVVDIAFWRTCHVAVEASVLLAVEDANAHGDGLRGPSVDPGAVVQQREVTEHAVSGRTVERRTLLKVVGAAPVAGSDEVVSSIWVLTTGAFRRWKMLLRTTALRVRSR